MLPTTLSQAELLDIIGAIYDCALNPDDWPAVFERVARHIGAISVALSVHDPIANKARFSASWNVPPDSVERYNTTYAAINPVMTSGWFCGIDEPVSAAVYCGPENYFRSRFVREFIAPLGWGDASGSHLMKMANRYSVLAMFVPWDAGIVSDQHLALVRALSPHVRRAVAISDLIDSRAVQGDMLSATLDLLTVGVVLTDYKGRIVHANRAAEALLDSAAGVTRQRDVLSARDGMSAAELAGAIAAAATGSDAMPPNGFAVPLRAVQGRDLAAWVLPLGGGQRSAWAAPVSAKAAVFIRELGDTTPFQGEIFVKRYGITPAECRVLMMLLQGLSIAETCDALGVRETTVRTHLAGLFAKTGSKGQADLMRLAMSAIAPARA